MIDPYHYNHVLNGAIAFHGGQLDYGCLPYIIHPMRVSESLLRSGASSDAVLAGLLHDVVEDTAADISDVLAVSNLNVAEIVSLLTRPEDGSTYAEYIQSIVDSGNVDAMAVKLADIEDNSRLDRRTGAENEPSLLRRYKKARDVILGSPGWRSRR